MPTKEYNKLIRDRFKTRHPKRGVDYHRKKKFGLTPEAFQAMCDVQNNLCAICNESELGRRNGVVKALAVDHNKKTGKIRKLLCSRCNTAIGLLRERRDLLDKVIVYLEFHK